MKGNEDTCSTSLSVIKTTIMNKRSKIPKPFLPMFDSGDIPFPICETALLAHRSSGNKEELVHYSKHNWDLIGSLGKTPTVCIHGLNGSRLLFSDLIRVVEVHYSHQIPLLVIDLFGHGLSACPNRPYTLSLFVDQLESLLTYLQLSSNTSSKKINIIGFSLGGAIAVGFAAKHPDLIEKLCLIAPAGFVPFKNTSGNNSEDVERGGGISPNVKYVKWIPSFLLALLMRTMFKSAFSRPQPQLPENVPSFIQEEHRKQTERLIWQSFVKKGTFDATISIVKKFPLFNMEKEFKAVSATRVGRETPVLLIWGTQDRVIPMNTCAPKIKSFFRNSYLFKVDDAGHVVLNEQPTVVISAILSFLQSPPDFEFSDI